MDYTKLIEALRIAQIQQDALAYGMFGSTRTPLYGQAADAIEELFGIVLTYEAANDMFNPHWISVDERLPEKWKHCLLRFKNNNDSWGGIELGYLASDGKTWSDANHTITHWMPLPEPPKERSEDA